MLPVPRAYFIVLVEGFSELIANTIAAIIRVQRKICEVLVTAGITVVFVEDLARSIEVCILIDLAGAISDSGTLGQAFFSFSCDSIQLCPYKLPVRVHRGIGSIWC